MTYNKIIISTMAMVMMSGVLLGMSLMLAIQSPSTLLTTEIHDVQR